MKYTSNDYPGYPGSDTPALHVDFVDLTEFSRKLGVVVTRESIGTFFDPARNLINIDTKTPNKRGFVSLGHLTDEYLHAWNQRIGRGRFLPAAINARHISFGEIAKKYGTKGLATQQNYSFHKLEALNFICSKSHIPSFIWRLPYSELRDFGYSWQVHET